MIQKIFIQKAVQSIIVFFLYSHLQKETNSCLSNQKAYTLIEILIAMAIIGIVSVIAVPQTNIWAEHYRLNGATRLVWGDLQSAKMTAIKNNQSITVTFDVSKTSYRFSQGVTIIFTRDLTHDYPRILVFKNGFPSGGGTITFTSTGITENSTITVQGPQENKSITTLWTGRILST